MSQTHNALVQTKLSVDRCLMQITHIQSLFLFCEPRNMGLDAEIADSTINMLQSIRKELRQSHGWINQGIEATEQHQEMVVA